MPTNPKTFVTFAYGSNMLCSRIQDQERCPSARALGVAELHGHELKWHKRSKDGSGKCDVVQAKDKKQIVYGVLFEIAASEKSELDTAEGRGNGYEEKQVQVVFGGAPRTVSLYAATKTDSSLKPYTWYKAFVVAGAKEHKLPSEYIRQLEAVEATQDPDRERERRNTQLLEGNRLSPTS
ncbi:MAG TPA: gamma-glutamylcyclotransferase family protein [Candidatus Angelobacter sp.]|nr:gamma-glutamylcyclotransferase family protein [Candidatus Angelobacter sp.]